MVSSQFGYFSKETFCTAYSIVGGNPWIAASDMDAIVRQGVQDHMATADVESSNAFAVQLCTSIHFVAFILLGILVLVQS